MTVKLYNLQRGDTFTLAEKVRTPPAAPEGRSGVTYEYSHVDGMYANVISPDGDTLYFAAWTDVEPVDLT